MKKFAGWRLWLEGGIGCLALTGTLHAAAPPAHVIATPAEAHAFEDDAPFVFSGQALDVQVDFSSDRSMVLERLAPIMVAPGVRFELTGELASSAAPTAAPLHKRGLGTLALTGANRHTSNTVLREGSLHVGGASPLGAPTYNLEQHAGTVLSFAPDTRILNFIQITPTRAGDAPLPGLEGVAEWRVESGQATLVNNVMAQAPIRKTGAGDLRVLDAIMSESFVSVEGGALVLDGSVIGRVDIGPGARLEGRGDFTAARVAGGGMVAPGGRDAAATLSAWRDVVFEPGGIYHVNAYADGRADLLDIFGKATLDGKVGRSGGGAVGGRASIPDSYGARRPAGHPLRRGGCKPGLSGSGAGIRRQECVPDPAP